MEAIKTKNEKLVEKTKDKIDAIAHSILKAKLKDPSLMLGLSGEALFWAYYNSYKRDKISKKIEPILSTVFDRINKGYRIPTFSVGLAGIGWTIEHLSKFNFIEADTDDIIGSLDNYLYPIMKTYIKHGNYDYLHGAMGIGLFYLERLTKSENKDRLHQLINEIGYHAINLKKGIAWESFKNLNGVNTKVINLSLSHGLASIISFLSLLHSKGISNKKVTDLVEQGIEFLLNTKQDKAKGLYKFPPWVPVNKSTVSGRLAWCYGDLGIGISLFLAGKRFNNKAWMNEANSIVLNTTNMIDSEITRVKDGCICHGTAGIAHIYNKMFSFTGNVTYKKSALYWYKQCLEMMDFEDGLAGYKTYRPDIETQWSNEYGFLEGIIGIGLSLLSFITDNSGWDRAILLS